jgi:hypothetical protein
MIRREDTKKHILIGVYDTAIAISPLVKVESILLPLSFFTRFHLEEDEHVPVSVRFTIYFNPEGSIPYNFSANLEFGRIRTIQLSFVISDLKIPYNSTKMNFEIVFYYADKTSCKLVPEGLEVKVVDPEIKNAQVDK